MSTLSHTLSQRLVAPIPVTGPMPTIVAIGIMVGLNFALAKFAMAHGIPAFAALFWQFFIASIVLLVTLAIKGERLILNAQYLRYYLIGGLLGVSGPQLIAYLVLAHIPAGLFAILITLSPLSTFVVQSVFERRWLPLHRLIGIVLGLIGVSLATLDRIDIAGADALWFAVALGAPLLLAVGNVYRNKAYPKKANALGLATGMVLSQVLLCWPVMLYGGYDFSPLDLGSLAEAVILIIGILTAVSYILTFAVQRKTDSLGFSQIGYFATVCGLAAGAIIFGEPLSVSLVIAIATLFLGLAITNGHLKFPLKFPTAQS